MTVNQTYGVDDFVFEDDSIVLDGSRSDTGAAEIWEIGGDGEYAIERKVDDGEWVEIETHSGNFYTDKNRYVVSQNTDQELRIVNTGTETTVILVTGIEVQEKEI